MKSPEYIRQILPYGFESFSITFWQTLGGADLKKLASEVKAVIGDKAVISSVSMFGDPLMNDAKAADTAKQIQLLMTGRIP